ncbi:hypothetical protein BDZ97DRAFT_90061 [Flammula alnicola]|nr:hypothetical protein BDZ97DRAFT_90061 [Flammula alnicola]
MSDNTPPPPSSFPNNFSRPSSAAAASSPSFSDSKFKSKRHSLNMSSSSTSSGPRPLHLALGSTVGSSPGSPAPTRSPGPSYATHLSNPAIYDVDVGVDTPTSAQNGFVLSSGSSPRGLAPLPLSPTITGLQQHATSRRQSSISYIPSNSPSHARFSKRDSVDSLNLGLMRSPLSSTYTTSANGGKSPGPGLARSSSLGGRGSRGSRSPAVGERSSTGSILANSNSDTAKGVAHLKERPPVTLAEKHAELLHFIAQKESKCLELRSQLAVHEAELLQLKRKWERIVNRGFEKALSPNSASSSTTSHLPSSPSPSSSVPPGFSTSPNNTASYFPTLNPNNTNAPAAVVLEGIKEGVQGMSRLIAAGLGSIAQVNVVPPANEMKSPGTPEASASTAPLPLRLGSVSQRRTNGSGHGQKESQSSSSTTASTASSATFSSLLSVSTTSSATSAGSTSGSSASGNTTTTNSVLETSGSFEVETESEFGDFEDGQLSLTRRSSTEQVLMVRDTGATPTMSPNPDFQRRRRRNDNVGFGTEDSLSASANATGLLVSETETNSFDWDDGWDEPAGEIQASEQLYATSSSTASTSTTKPAIADRAKLSLGNGTTNRPKSPLAPASSIPGLAAVSMGVAAPSTQQMSSWVGSVGKRWGEIKGSTA